MHKLDAILISIFKWAWMGLLAYVVIGGSLALAADALGLVGADCSDETLRLSCKPCNLYRSEIGALKIFNCDSALLNGAVTAIFFIPHLFLTAFAALIIYPVVETLAQVSPHFPALALFSLIGSVTGWTCYLDFRVQKNMTRGIHSLMMAMLFLLGTLLALQF